MFISDCEFLAECEFVVVHEAILNLVLDLLKLFQWFSSFSHSLAYSFSFSTQSWSEVSVGDWKQINIITIARTQREKWGWKDWLRFYTHLHKCESEWAWESACNRTFALNLDGKGRGSIDEYWLQLIFDEPKATIAISYRLQNSISAVRNAFIWWRWTLNSIGFVPRNAIMNAKNDETDG